MIWRASKKNHLIMVYGFDKDLRHYDSVLTLYVKNQDTYVYGFLSKTLLTTDTLRALYRCLQEVITTPYMMMEVLPEHARFYKVRLPVISSTSVKTFDGFDGELLKIDIKQQLRV